MPKRDFNKVAKGPKLGKLTKKIGRPKVEPNGTKLGLKLGFSPFSKVWHVSFPLNSTK